MPEITSFFAVDGVTRSSPSKKRKLSGDDAAARKAVKKEEPDGGGGSSGFAPGNPFDDQTDYDAPFERAKRDAAANETEHKPKRGASRRNLMWFKSDLRTLDNRALHAASLDDDAATIALWVLCPGEWENHNVSPAKADFIFRNLAVLGDVLEREYRIPLVVLQCDRPRHILPAIEAFVKEHDIGKVYYNEEYEVNERARDKKVKARLEELGVKVTGIDEQNVVPPASLFSPAKRPYTVYSPYARAWLARVGDDPDRYLALAPPPRANSKDSDAKLPTRTDLSEMQNPRPLREVEHDVPKLFPAGETEAHFRVSKFRAGPMKNYVEGRNIPSNAGTSKLSPYLANGIISNRQCVWAALNGQSPKRIASIQQGHARWVSELIWRDFYRMIMFNFPQICKYEPFLPQTKGIRWREGPEADADFDKWTRGQTGYPLIDAAMRQLAHTCYMHNRCRMNVASFLCKHLLIDWRRGEKWFSEKLIDADLASNNGGWQWTASSGTDPQPYFRIFAPTLQSEKFDPDGEYIRHYVPELRACPRADAASAGKKGGKKLAMAIHEPYTRWGAKECKKAGYPEPIVDHKFARQRCLTEYKRAYDEYKEKGAPATDKY